MIKDNIYILLISETKTDLPFPTTQLYINRFTTSRLERNIYDSGILLDMTYLQVFEALVCL